MTIERVEVLFDQSNPNWSKTYGYNHMFLQAQRNWANQLLTAHGFLTLNQVFEMLSLPLTEQGAVAGWVSDGNTEIDFGDEADVPPPTNKIKLQFNINSNNVFRDNK